MRPTIAPRGKSNSNSNQPPLKPFNNSICNFEVMKEATISVINWNNSRIHMSLNNLRREVGEKSPMFCPLLSVMVIVLQLAYVERACPPTSDWCYVPDKWSQVSLDTDLLLIDKQAVKNNKQKREEKEAIWMTQRNTAPTAPKNTNSNNANSNKANTANNNNNNNRINNTNTNTNKNNNKKNNTNSNTNTNNNNNNNNKATNTNNNANNNNKNTNTNAPKNNPSNTNNNNKNTNVNNASNNNKNIANTNTNANANSINKITNPNNNSPNNNNIKITGKGKAKPLNEKEKDAEAYSISLALQGLFDKPTPPPSPTPNSATSNSPTPKPPPTPRKYLKLTEKQVDDMVKSNQNDYRMLEKCTSTYCYENQNMPCIARKSVIYKDQGYAPAMCKKKTPCAVSCIALETNFTDVFVVNQYAFKLVATYLPTYLDILAGNSSTLKTLFLQFSKAKNFKEFISKVNTNDVLNLIKLVRPNFDLSTILLRLMTGGFKLEELTVDVLMTAIGYSSGRVKLKRDQQLIDMLPKPPQSSGGTDEHVNEQAVEEVKDVNEEEVTEDVKDVEEEMEEEEKWGVKEIDVEKEKKMMEERERGIRVMSKRIKQKMRRQQFVNSELCEECGCGEGTADCGECWRGRIKGLPCWNKDDDSNTDLCCQCLFVIA